MKTSKRSHNSEKPDPLFPLFTRIRRIRDKIDSFSRLPDGRFVVFYAALGWTYIPYASVGFVRGEWYNI